MTVRDAGAAERLRGEIVKLRQASEEARVDFKLQLAVCCNVRVIYAVPEDHGNDMVKLKDEEPWLFSDDRKPAKDGETTWRAQRRSRVRRRKCIETLV